jgi:PPOX class probable F420-dependent enzyme
MSNLDIAVIDAGLRRRITRARVGHLATSSGATPAVVPVCFVLLGETVYQAIDGKPKSVDPGKLRRVKNVRANPRAALLIDHYVEDWRRLWWVLLRGRARIIDRGPVIAIDLRRIRHWRSASPGRGRAVRRGQRA